MKTSLSAIVLALVISFGVWYFVSSKNSTVPILGNEYGQNQNVELINSSNESQFLENNQQKIMKGTINTNKGNITIEFLENLAPNTVANFVKLAESGFYNGVKFHRVIPGFMIQGGDPLTKDNSKKAMWGTGGPGYTFADEISQANSNSYGTISMANSGPNTNGSQFFINVADNNFLDPKHTVFGKVTNGMEVVEMISKVDTDPNDRPIEEVVILSIKFE
jgi:peptidylprolyl isomerase